MNIQITAQHIKDGVEGNCRECPTALALCEVLNEDYYPVVRASSIFINHKTKMYIGREFTVPRVIQDFINWYDRGYDVHPVEFELDIPPEMLKNANEG